MIKVVCACSQRLAVPDSYAGRTVRCKKCGSAVQVVEQAEEHLSPAEPDALAELASMTGSQEHSGQVAEASNRQRRGKATPRRSKRSPVLVPAIIALLFAATAGTIIYLNSSGFIGSNNAAGKSDLAKLEFGFWHPVRVETQTSVVNISPDKAQDSVLIFYKGRISNPTKGARSEVPFRIDESTTPKQMDWGAGKETLRGIYRIEGDELTICFAYISVEVMADEVTGLKNQKETELPRPTSFDRQQGSILVFRRR